MQSQNMDVTGASVMSALTATAHSTLGPQRTHVHNFKGFKISAFLRELSVSLNSIAQLSSKQYAILE